MNGRNNKNNERGLLPYTIIIAANAGEAEAMNVVLQHYDSYITSLSIRKVRDEHDNSYMVIDESVQARLQSKLIQSVLAFKI